MSSALEIIGNKDYKNGENDHNKGRPCVTHALYKPDLEKIAGASVVDIDDVISETITKSTIQKLFGWVKTLGKQVTCHTINCNTEDNTTTENNKKNKNKTEFYMPKRINTITDDRALKCWQTEEIIINVAIKFFAPIPGIAITEKNKFLLHCRKMMKRLNDDFNCENDDFDSVDFENDLLFSLKRNPLHASKNRKYYSAHLRLASRSNIRFNLAVDECVYDPTWNRFKQSSKEDQAVLRNCNHPMYRKVVDRLVKLDKMGKPVSSDPKKYINIFFVDKFDDSLCGYGTFPFDVQAGGPFDGIVANEMLFRTDESQMPSSLNKMRTLSHEMGHNLGLLHTFEKNNGTSDIPPQQVSYGNPLNKMQWPCTKPGVPDNVTCILNYTDDTILRHLTYSQCLNMRRELLNPASSRNSLVTVRKLNKPIEIKPTNLYKH